jgi:hypothetical protein
MADENPLHKDYRSNSNASKETTPEPERKVEPVISGTAVQRKKSLGRRIAESFKGEDTQTVGQYLLFSVVIPQIKDLIYDIGEGALRRLLNGDTARGYTGGVKSAGGKRYVSYGSASTQGAVSKAGAQNSQQRERSDDFEDIIVETRGDAQEVMDKMANLIETYGMASVNDLKSAVGLTGKFTDDKWGWITMGGTDIRRVGGATPGYVLIFPRPEAL